MRRQGSFNSTLVRLEDYSDITHFLNGLFQFHFGSIGSYFLTFTLPRFLMFQFHFGSIGSERIRQQQIEGATFQFHFGSIGRFRLFFENMTKVSFNSTLVRLEAILFLGKYFK